MNNHLTKLETRAILEISGLDRKKFLQGLITNDVNKTSQEHLIFSAMLNSQGRFLYDFFIFEDGEKLVVDCPALRRDEILQKLNFYKLRALVEIRKNDEILVTQSFENIGFADPRCKALGNRFYLKKSEEKNFTFQDSSKYHFTRISNKIADGELDLSYEKSFILEFGFDDLNAIDYQKGCYVGQELTARTHYRGEIRKKLFHIKINDITAQNLKDCEITCEGKTAGIILSSTIHEKALHALALIKISEEEFAEKLEFQGNKIFIIN